MWLSQEEERLLAEIYSTSSLSEEELKAVKIYKGFKSAKELDPE